MRASSIGHFALFGIGPNRPVRCLAGFGLALLAVVNAPVNDGDDRQARPGPGFWDWLRSLF